MIKDYTTLIIRRNMFLRWMIRNDNRGVDFGIWKSMSPSILSCPLDIHSGNVARKLGITSPVGESILMESSNQKGDLKTIIGVVKDFHMQSLYQDVDPMVIMYSMNDIRKAIVRVAPNSIDKTFKEIKSVFTKLFPEEPFEYTFVEEGLKAKYISETRLQYVVIFFSILAICISILGLIASGTLYYSETHP